MSQMTLLPPKQRYDVIKDYVAEENFNQIAKRCGCTRKTIYRDIHTMKALGIWYEWLERAMLRYGRKKTVSDTAKFNKYADLFAKKALTSKIASTIEHKGKVGLDINALLKTYEELFTEDAVQEDDTGKPIHTTHTNGGTSRVPPT